MAMSEQYGTKAASAETSKRASPAKLHRIEIEIGHNGGHTVTHHMRRQGLMNGPYVEPKSHIFGASENGKLKEHLMKHLGLGASEQTLKPEDGEE